MERVSTPHPVEQAAEYQRYLTGLVGDDDPADVQADGPGAWRALVEEAGDLVAERPEPGEWSVLGCLGHAVDAEVVSSARYRWILAHDEPELVGYDQDLWANALHGPNDDPELLLSTFEALRRANLALWARSGEQDKARFGIHAERGPESYELTFRLIAGHDRFHLDQARRALAAVRPG
ncbi:MAG: DinB family protein [Actinobacteria bacterium]|nr:DinB family protein [Actinomycetota bacterium]